MGAMNMANRWTFIIDPTLTIREIEKDVDPVLDAKKVADKIAELQKNPADTEPSITPSKKKSASQ
jgi:peroxiredoxin